MATITKQWCSWDRDTGKVSFTYDDFIAGTTSAQLSGTVTSIPLAAPSTEAVSGNTTVAVGGVNFTAQGSSPLGSTSISVHSQSVSPAIASGSTVTVPQTGFPNGKFTGLSWVNGSQLQQVVRMTLRPGVTSADMPAGTYTAVVLAAGADTPTVSGLPVDAGSESFVASASEAVGATSLAVTSHATTTDIPAGTRVLVPLPPVTIPPSGQTATLPAFYGSGQIGSTGSVSVASLGIPMSTVTSHGIVFPDPPDLNCT